MDRDALERAARRAGEIFVEIYQGLEKRRVDPGVTRDEMARRFTNTLTEDGRGLVATLDEVAKDVIPACMGTPHPLYFGLINTSPLPGAALADLLVSALNNNAGAFHQSPAFTALETEVIASFVRELGLGSVRHGMFLPGGTYANLQALVLARSRRGPNPRLYTSASSHFSVARAAHVVGLEAHEVVAIPSRGRGELDQDELARRIQADRAAGHTPFCVVATAGTTGTGAIDPLDGIAGLCEREKLWLHVDACYGGAALLVDGLRSRLRGIERADSVSIDPHKWFYMPLTGALLLTRHPDIEKDAFDTDASYIPGDDTVDPFRRGIPTSRRASGATAWIALRAHGWRTVRESVKRNIELTRLLERLLRERGFRVLEEGELSIACARWEALGDRQAELARRVVATGRTWFATVRHAGEVWLRFNMVNLHVREEHVRQLVTLLETCVK
jgi:aromatic-L-amino-acid decarboxylase